MEVRKLKMNFLKSGSGSMNTKANIPITDCRDMGITTDDRDYFYHYNTNNDIKVTILSKEDLSDYDIVIKKKNK